MASHSHRGLHHSQHPSAAASDASGWVESIGSLDDTHPATALLLGASQAATASHTNLASIPTSSNGIQAAEPMAVMTLTGVPSGCQLASDGDKLSTQQEFEASLEHGLGVMMAEVRLAAPITFVVSPQQQNHPKYCMDSCLKSLLHTPGWVC